jgi:FAD-dependent urate hydroxylase
MRVLIVGAGMGGLTAGLALRRAGFDVVVLEQAAELREVGAGISLWPNAINALRRLGVGEAVEANGRRVIDNEIRDWRGGSLHRSSTDRIEARFGAPLIMIRRAALHEILREALGHEALRLGNRCVTLDQDDHGVRLGFDGGGSEQGDVLIGADGLRSMVRAATVADGDPRHSGLQAWRAVVSVDRSLADQLAASEYWGHGSLFGVQSLGADAFYWYAASKARESDQVAGSDKEVLLRRFGSWHSPIPELIEATDADTVLSNDLYDRRVPSSLAFGRVALLGDAAHPMLPLLGQGACQAIEDGEAMARALGEAADPASGLRLYSERRLSTATLAVTQSRRMSKVALARHPIAVRLRNSLLKHTSEESSLKRLAPIVAGDPREPVPSGVPGQRPAERGE